MLYKLRISKDIKISKEAILWAVLLHPFLKPNGISSINPRIDMIYDIAIVISFMILLIMYLVRKDSLNINIVLTGLFVGWITLITALKDGQTLTLFRIILQYVGLALAVKKIATKPNILFRSMLLNLEVLIYLNFILMLLFPQGMYIAKQNGNWNNWLLGYDNHWFIVFFGAMFISIVHLINTKKILRPLLLISVIHISGAITDSGVIIFGLALIDIITITKLYKMDYFTYRNVWIVALIANIFVVFFSTSGITTFIVYQIFHKTDSSILARLRIWGITFEAIRNNPILGYGHQPTIIRTTMYHNNHASNAHNFLMEIVYEGGIVGIGLFAMLCFYTGKNISSVEESDIRQILLVCILACLVTGSVDSLLESRGALFFWMLSIGYCIPIICKSGGVLNRFIQYLSNHFESWRTSVGIITYQGMEVRI